MAEQTVASLSSAQLSTVLRLMKAADGVELKLSVPDADQRSAIKALGMDPVEAEIRQVVFFDTPDLDLDQRGVVVRARRVQRKPADSIIKLRPVEPDSIDSKLRTMDGFGVEVDAMPGGFVCSASMKGEVDPLVAKSVFWAEQPIRKLFNKDQRNFFAQHGPNGLTLDDLSMLGPINLLKLKFTPEGFGRRMVAELWMYPDASRILELSTKCRADEAFDVAAVMKAFLTDKGVEISGAQQTKTRTALQYFAANLTG